MSKIDWSLHVRHLGVEYFIDQQSGSLYPYRAYVEAPNCHPATYIGLNAHQLHADAVGEATEHIKRRLAK